MEPGSLDRRAQIKGVAHTGAVSTTELPLRPHRRWWAVRSPQEASMRLSWQTAESGKGTLNGTR